MQAEILLTLKLQQKLFADPRRISLLNTLRFPARLVRARKTRESAIRAPGMR